MAASRLLPFLVLILVPVVPESKAQDRFEAPVGPRTWSPADSELRSRFEGSTDHFRKWGDLFVLADTVKARRRAYDAADVDPGILIYPDTLVDGAMVIPAPERVDPHMILPPTVPRHIGSDDVHEAPSD